MGLELWRPKLLRASQALHPLGHGSLVQISVHVRFHRLSFCILSAPSPFPVLVIIQMIWEMTVCSYIVLYQTLVRILNKLAYCLHCYGCFKWNGQYLTIVMQIKRTIYWRSLFATQAAIQTLQWQWAYKDRYVHRTLYKILKIKYRETEKLKNILLNSDSNVIKFTKNNVFTIFSRCTSSNIKFTL